MNSRRALAVELLMSYPESTVAEMLGVRLKTLTRWMAMPDFADALRQRERSQRQSLSRIARQSALRAAASLCQLAGNGEPAKVDPKVLLDVIKTSGAFEKDESDSADALIEIINRTMNSDEGS